MHDEQTFENTCDDIFCDLISALDEVDVLEKLTNLIEMLHLIEDQERVYVLLGIYLEEHEAHVKRVRAAINSARSSLIARCPKKSSSIVHFFVEAS